MKSIDLPTDARQAPPIRSITLAALRELIDASASTHPLFGFVDSAFTECGGSEWKGVFLHWLDTSDDRLAGAGRRFDLGPAQALAVAIAAHAEIDPAFARVVAWLQAPVAGGRPTLGLLAAAVAPLAGRADVLALKHGRAAALELLSWSDADDVLAAQEARVPDAVLHALGVDAQAEPGTDACAKEAPCPSQRVLLDGALNALRRIGMPLVLRSPDPDEARTRRPMSRGQLGVPSGWIVRSGRRGSPPRAQSTAGSCLQRSPPRPASASRSRNRVFRICPCSSSRQRWRRKRRWRHLRGTCAAVADARRTQ
jgi:hypothetical protein